MCLALAKVSFGASRIQTSALFLAHGPYVLSHQVFVVGRVTSLILCHDVDIFRILNAVGL